MGVKKIVKVDYELVGSSNSFDRIVEQIASQDYQAFYNDIKNCRDKYIEMDGRNGHGVPPMNEVFYGYYGKHKVFPSWTHYLDLYWDRYIIKSPKNPGQFTFAHENPRFHYSFREGAIQRKLMNGYMSFLKEQYIMHWLFKMGLTTAYWSLKRDSDYGIDISVKNLKHKEYGIKVFSDTAGGRKYAEIKRDKRHPGTPTIGVGIISVPVPIGDRYKIGCTCVTSDTTLKCLYNLITFGVTPITFKEYPNGRVTKIPELIL